MVGSCKFKVLASWLFKDCWTAFGQFFGPSWTPVWSDLEPLGRLLEPTWCLLGASWSQLGASWAPLGASWAPLGLHLGALAASWAQLGAFWEPQGLHLALPTGLLLYFICTAQGAAKFNNTSFVVPQGLPSATEEHCQRSSSSPDGDICNTSITILLYTKLLYYFITTLLY